MTFGVMALFVVVSVVAAVAFVVAVIAFVVAVLVVLLSSFQLFQNVQPLLLLLLSVRLDLPSLPLSSCLAGELLPLELFDSRLDDGLSFDLVDC